MLQNFEILQQKTDALLVSLGELAEQRKNREIAKRLGDLRERLSNNRFAIAAFGAFSSGKSTFLNALVGEKLFPSQHTPTTATINYLQYRREPHLRVHFHEKEEIKKRKKAGIEEYKKADLDYPKLGKSIDGDVSDLRELSRENVESIYMKSIEIGYPSEHLKPEDVIWIDTPGTDSIVEYHKKVTYSLIDQADAILFFIYAPIPFKDSDWLFLQDIYAIRSALSTDKFFFIVNAIDGLEDQDTDEIVSYVKSQLERRAGLSAPQLIPVSSKLALYARKYQAGSLSERELRELKKMLFSFLDDPNISDADKMLAASNFPKMEAVLSEFLMQEKGVVLLQSTLDRALGNASELRRDIETRRWALGQSVEELNKKMQEDLLPLLQEKEDSLKEILGSLKEELSAIKVELPELEYELEQAVEAQLESTHKINSEEIESIVFQAVYTEKTELAEKLQRLVEKKQKELEKVFQDYNKSLAAQINLDWDANKVFSAQSLKDIQVETIRVQSGGSWDDSLTLTGALVGGVLAALVPGGLGLIGGSIIGGLLGNALDENTSANKVTRLVTDIMGSKRKAMASLKPEVEKIKKEFSKLLGQQKKALFMQVRKDAESRLKGIRRELARIQKEHERAQSRKAETEKILQEEESALQKIEENLHSLKQEIFL